MSDAMTNREIEDVLTSIRRLVAQEGTRPTESGKLILTEDQRIVAPEADNSSEPVTTTAEVRQPEIEAPELTQVEEAPVMTGPRRDTAVVEQGETDVAEESAEAAEVVDDSIAADDPTPSASDLNLPEPDFGKLEATIAELEAAVSASGEPWEPEAAPAEETPRPSNVTDLYGRLSFGRRNAPAPEAEPEAEPETDEVAEADVGAQDDLEPVQETVADVSQSAEPETSGAEEMAEPVDLNPEFRHQAATDVNSDGGTAADEEIEDTILDEAALRAVIAQIVREELHGQLGERVTQQVRKLVRAEIAKALDGHRYM